MHIFTLYYPLFVIPWLDHGIQKTTYFNWTPWSSHGVTTKKPRFLLSQE
ncbi:hypothetical protein [Rickettsia asembonensis]|nr:hypothetical protein [Rickettsia asembonensis]